MKLDLKSFLFLGILGFCANIITWLVIFFKIKPTAEVIPLHYNVFFGTDVAGKGYYIYLIPAAGLVILAVNYLFGRYAARHDQFAADMLTATTLVVQVVILIAVLFLKSVILI